MQTGRQQLRQTERHEQHVFGGLASVPGGLAEGAGGLAEGAAREQRVQGPGGGVRVEGPEDERQDEQVEDED